MNRYPLWKYIVIGVALVIGFFYALPNLFPDAPAVQVSSSKTGVKIDSTLLATVEDALKSAGIAYRGEVLDPTGVKVRFADFDTQVKAKEVLQGKLGDNYIVALNLLSSSPQWLSSIGALPAFHSICRATFASRSPTTPLHVRSCGPLSQSPQRRRRRGRPGRA